MPTSSTLGYGSVLQALISSSYTSITGLRSFSLPKLSVTVIDITVLLSAQHTKEKRGGFIDPGDITCEAVWNSTAYNTLFTLTGITGTWRIILSNGSRLDFDGFVKALDGPVPLDGEVVTNFAVEATGPIVFTP